MNRNRFLAVPTIALAAVAAVAVLGGCASPPSAPRAVTPAPAADTSMSAGMSAGVRMPDGSIMGAAATSPATPPAAARPSASALMVCSEEVRGDVRQVAQLATAPTAMASFAHALYTCTYSLPIGTFVVSVKDLPDTAATTTYFNQLRGSLPGAADLAGLGDGAFGTGDGRVALRKDAHVLLVDASRLPAIFGTQSQKRTDFAYEIASDILGCWTDG